MANQRAQVVMTHDEQVALLHRRRSASVGTIGPDGAIHLVGMWYALRGEHVWIETKARSQKVVNLRRDPRMSFLVEAGETYDQLRGVSIEGTGVVVEESDVVWDVCKALFERYHAPYTEEARPLVEAMAHNRVAVRLEPDRVRSWDHRKLGLPTMALGGSTAAYVD
jgi:PPOX class probable F420-dependent enzyme